MNQIILIINVGMITMNLSVLSQTIAVVNETVVNVLSISEMKIKNSYAHCSLINCIDVFSGNYLIAGTEDNKILLYDFVKGELNRKLTDKNSIRAIQKVNESYFITVYKNGLTLWNFHTDQNYFYQNTNFGTVNCIKVKSDEKKIVMSTQDAKVFILSSENLQILHEFNFSRAEIEAIFFVDSNFIVIIKKNNQICKLDEDEIKNLAVDSNFRECVNENRNVNVIKVANQNKIFYGIDHNGNTFDNYKIWEEGSDPDTIADSNRKNSKRILSIEIINDSMVITGDNFGNLYFFENSLPKRFFSLGNGKVGCIRKLSSMEIEKIISSNIGLTKRKLQITSSKIEFTTIQNIQSTIFTKYLDINSNIKITTEQQTQKKDTTRPDTASFSKSSGDALDKKESTKETHFINSIFTNIQKTSKNDQWNGNENFKSTPSTNLTKGEIENFSTQTLTGGILNDSGKTTEIMGKKSDDETLNLQATFSDMTNFSKKLSNIINNLSSVFEIETEQLMNVMASKIDMVDCLTNCTNNGKCKLNNNEKFICECDEHHIGPRCQIDSRPCASNPCLNGAKCFNNFAQNIYKCECVTKNGSVLFYGANCEKKIDVCENETCSKNGVCYDVENEPECKCFKSYSGEKCQVESQEMKTVKTVIRTSSIIAIIVLCVTYFFFLIIDLSNFLTKRKKKNLIKS